MLYTNALLEVRARLQELVPDFWLDNEVYRALNEGTQRFAQEEKWPYLYTVKTGVALGANTPTLALEPGVAYERAFNLQILFAGDSRPRPIQRVSPTEGYRLRLGWYTAVAEPMAFYIASSASSAGVYTATIHLVPTLSRACTIEYMYVRDPVIVAAPTSEHMDVPEEYAMGVVAYATGHLFLKELQFSQKAEEQFALYQKVIQDAKRESRKLIPDQGFAWGRNQPEYGYVEDDTLLTVAWPTTLGP